MGWWWAREWRVGTQSCERSGTLGLQGLLPVERKTRLMTLISEQALQGLRALAGLSVAFPV